MHQESNFYINDVDWAQELQGSIEEYMMTLMESIDSDEDVETVTNQPFCGCDVCYWREVLAFVSPKIMQAQLAGKIELSKEND